ncbi:PKD domain-containing protein [Pedobacter sp. GSP4]|uniref:PKD domain-containing protein n=1 Tax=Pedobacter sp. GSP4 TaxID=3453716 RepID=UPI003EF0737B
MAILLQAGVSGAQIVSVNQSSGAAAINIPIYTLKRGKITVPISLFYYGSGVRAKDIEGSAGMNWQISAGGAITREMRDVPDDLADNSKGWLYNNNAIKINNFTIANDGNQGTCNDEGADHSYIANNLGDLSDTEPDVFNISVPGLSCKLFFDGSHQPKTIPYRDIKVSYTTDWAGIDQFKITNDQGLTYTFGMSEMIGRKAGSANPAGIQFFKRKYDVSQSVNFRSKWCLTSIKDNNGNEITFRYAPYQNDYRVSRKYYGFYIGNTTTKTNQFYVEDGSFTLMLTGIDYITDDAINDISKFTFTYEYNARTYMPLLASISGPGRGWNLLYDQAYVPNSEYHRYFLKEFRENSAESAMRYRFEYNGLSVGALQKVFTTLPDSSSNQLDRWGYYNASPANSLLPEVLINPGTAGMERFRYEQVPSLAANYPYSVSGNSRAVYPAALITGSLSKVSLLDGGTTEIEYEPNTYFDPQAGADMYGSGIRVKKLTTYDLGVPGVQKVVNYSYTDPATGHTSGRALSLPIYAFLRPSALTLNPESDWKNAIVRSDEDLSEAEDGVMYSFFKESIAGQGYTTSEFSLPATHFDLSAGPDWTRGITNIAGCSGSGGVLNNDRDLYPFIPNMDVSFERGMPSRERVYNEAGQKLLETIYSFTRAGSAQSIPAFRREYNNGILAYAKYNVLTGVESVIQQKQEFSFDVASGQQKQATTTYAYQGNGHIYPTKVESQNGDGRVLRVLTKYLKDYDATVATDSASLAIKSMVAKNINIPIETINQVERGGLNKTVSASLARFAVFNPGGEQPAKTLSFRNAAGVTDFQFSNIQAGNFTNDSRYFATANFTDYNFYGQLLSGNDTKGRYNAALYDDYSRLTLANIANARHDEVLYSNFEEGNLAGLWPETTAQGSATAHSGLQSIFTSPSTVLSRNVKKKVGAKFYTLSAWINTGTASNLQATVTNLSTSQVLSSSTGITADANWKHYQLRIPVEAMGQEFKVRLWGATAMLIDDIVFKPEEASVQVNNYDAITENKLATVSDNGAAAKYDFDSVNRLKRVYDRDGNLVQKTTYILGTNQDQFAPVFSMNEDQVVNEAVYLSISSYPIFNGDGLTYTWNFGDGSPTVVSSSPFGVVHTYTQVGNYSASVTKSSPYYGSVTVTQNIRVSLPAVSNTKLYSSSGDMMLTFYQNGQIVQQFSQSQFSSGTANVGPGAYTIRVGVSSSPYSGSNPYGYRSIQFVAKGPNNTNIVASCLSSQPGLNIYEFYLDLTGKESLTIGTDTQICVPPSVE